MIQRTGSRVEERPEGGPIGQKKTLSIRILVNHQRTARRHTYAAKALLHLGKRAAVDQALSRFAERGKLLRARRGVYLRPVESRFEFGAPSVEKVIEETKARSGEIIVSSGGAAANNLDLTTQVPVRQVYLTSKTNIAVRQSETDPDRSART
jgi:predicted transcriptional regulator of viral defense system